MFVSLPFYLRVGPGQRQVERSAAGGVGGVQQEVRAGGEQAAQGGQAGAPAPHRRHHRGLPLAVLQAELYCLIQQ